MSRSIPTLTTWTVGQLVTAALMNSNILALGTFLLSPPLAAMVQTLSQSIPNNQWTSINLDTNQIDSDGGHSTVSNTSQYVIQVPGTYLACGSNTFSGNATGVRATRIAKNGSPYQGSGNEDGPDGASGLISVATPMILIPCVASDVLQLQAFQTTGAGLSTSVNPDMTPVLTVLRVSN